MITLFKHHGSNCEPEFMSIGDALSRIKRGVSKSALEKIRNEQNKDKRDKLKLNTLPMIIFQGKFSSRHNKSMIELSGFMIADFDGFPNIQTLESEKAKLKADKYSYSVFISPSGNGLKLLVKIPKCESNQEYNERFEALAKYWAEKSKFWDNNNKGWVRTCFESFDQNIYINKESELFDGRIKKEVNEFKPQHGTEISEDYEVFRLLTEERECKNLNWNEGGRNNALYFLASRCNDYNISIFSAERMIMSYISGCGLSDSEIKATIKSAYSQQSANKSYVKPLANKSYVKPLEQTPVPTHNYSNKEEDIRIFWSRSSRGTLKLDFYETKMFLQENGFFRYEIDTSKYIFIRITENIIEEVDLLHIKDFILQYLETIGEIEVYNMVAENSKFRKEYINYLEAKDIKFCKDTATNGYIFFKNCFVDVSKDSIVKKDYSKLPGYIWKKQIIDRDFKKLEFDKFEQCDVAKFSCLVSNHKKDRIEAYISSMGYLMHGFKTYKNSRAIIYNDEVMSLDGEPMGRSGKGLTLKFVNKMRVCVTLPGKSFDPTKETSLQRVSNETQVIFLDDVNKSFDFENLFNWITEGIIVRKLYAGEVWIPFEDAPKIAITTNYTIKGDNNSHDDRRFEIEIHPYFNPNHRPSDEFGRDIFMEWDDQEWLRFDNFMCWCMQHYLQKGLIKPKYINLQLKKLHYKTNSDFVVWSEDNLKSGKKYEKKELFIKMKNKFSDDPWYSKNFTAHRFNGWMKAYANFKGWRYVEDGSGNKYITFLSYEGQEVEKVKEMPF